MNERAEKLVMEMTEALENEILPKAKDLLKAREEAEKKLARFKEKAEAYQRQSEELKNQIVDMETQVSDTVAEGGEPKSIIKQVKDKKDQAKELEDWGKKLSQRGIPQAEKELKIIEGELWDLACSWANSIARDYEEEFFHFVEDYIDAWPRAVQSVVINKLSARRGSGSMTLVEALKIPDKLLRKTRQY